MKAEEEREDARKAAEKDGDQPLIERIRQDFEAARKAEEKRREEWLNLGLDDRRAWFAEEFERKNKIVGPSTYKRKKYFSFNKLIQTE